MMLNLNYSLWNHYTILKCHLFGKQVDNSFVLGFSTYLVSSYKIDGLEEPQLSQGFCLMPLFLIKS